MRSEYQKEKGIRSEEKKKKRLTVTGMRSHGKKEEKEHEQKKWRNW